MYMYFVMVIGMILFYDKYGKNTCGVEREIKISYSETDLAPYGFIHLCTYLEVMMLKK